MLLHDPGVAVFGAIVKSGDSVERARDRLIEVVEHSLVQTAPTRPEMDRMRRSARPKPNARWPILRALA